MFPHLFVLIRRQFDCDSGAGQSLDLQFEFPPAANGIQIRRSPPGSETSQGATTDDLLDAYPRLTKYDIHACLVYTADTIAREETVTTEPA